MCVFVCRGRTESASIAAGIASRVDGCIGAQQRRQRSGAAAVAGASLPAGAFTSINAGGGTAGDSNLRLHRPRSHHRPYHRAAARLQ